MPNISSLSSMPSPLAHSVVMFMAVALVIGLAGCFESKYPLAPRSAAPKLDPRLLGHWTLEQLDEDGQVNVTRLHALNLRGEEYFIEWISGEGEDDRFFLTAYLTDVNGVTFANLLPLSDSADVAEKYSILRVDFDGEKLKIRNLDGDFFKNKSYASSDALRQIIAQNLDNEAMYRGEPFYGIKQEK